MIPPTLAIPDGVAGGHESQQQFGNAFPDGGNDYHQSTLQWADISCQEAEMSMTSLVTTKPKQIENETRQEVSVFLPLRKSCSISMALAIVKQSDSLQLSGELQPR